MQVTATPTLVPYRGNAPSANAVLTIPFIGTGPSNLVVTIDGNGAPYSQPTTLYLDLSGQASPVTVRFSNRCAYVAGVKVLGVIGAASVFGTVCPGAYAHFSGGGLGWLSNSYVAPGLYPIASSVDALGGTYHIGPTNYVAAGSVYPSVYSETRAGWTYWNNGGVTTAANGGAIFGTQNSVATGTASATLRWVWDLAAAGYPPIATVGIVASVLGISGYPVNANAQVQVSDDGLTWTTLFTHSAGGTTIDDVAVGDSNHRYWSLLISESSSGIRAWTGELAGFMLWAGVAVSGTLTYPEAWF